MKKFVKKNGILFVLFCMSVVVCILYIISMDKVELFPHAGDWFNLLFQFAIGFIINFIFFITQIYIPQYKQNKEIYRCVSDRIRTITRLMEEIFIQLGDLYMEGYDENRLSEDYWVEQLHKLRFDDRVHVYNVNRLDTKCVTDEARFHVGEWIGLQVDQVSVQIDKLLQYYAPYININLMNTLEEILKSKMHKSMVPIFLSISNGVPFDNYKEDCFFEPYYKLMKQLETIEMEYRR
ncbi:hypothetical protein SAMN02910358_00744 [Lachnospiraceae bacterium XBB1006]|nr:hypothetical protein SAMN02910358_00744 [Lachnospiraceae bacterium XBB1006]